MIKRPPIKHRKTPRAMAKQKLREKVRLEVFERSKGMCELKRRQDCLSGPLPFKGKTPWSHGHLVHLKSEESGGKTDTENCRWGCWRCHLLALHRSEVSATNKPVPAKVRPDWADQYYGN